MADKEQYAHSVTDKIFELYTRYGNEEYGEQVTMLMHMMQSALIAEYTGFNDEMIIAAFLHDIGHFFEHESPMGDLGNMAHDNLGSRFLLDCGFPERMARLVGSHVAAKRYLTWSDSAYYETLSDASKQTLEYQGGPMQEAEAIAFRNDPLFQQYIQIRVWDDMGKETGIPVQEADLERMRGKMITYLIANGTPPEN
ncbi:HD domain-containing protein [Chitinophaga sp. 212800010-3]|jgi:predicted HD phosphohydrolase|uniref:HD domain-containing protein n=1 Tax=unclassified Chitinophaga TaxID=2619133 RepID=UPI002DF28F65|nr:Metal dependent phosphohydrolase [Chitinophaga sp. 212800010-3]